MSGLEVVAAVAAVVSAFHGGSEIMKMIKERNQRKALQGKFKPKSDQAMRAQIQQEMAQDQLVEALYNGGVQVKGRYDHYYRHWTLSFSKGDHEVRHSLEVVATESKIMYDFLRDARDEVKPLPDVVKLQELANKNKFMAQAALDAYHLRLLTEGAPVIQQQLHQYPWVQQTQSHTQPIHQRPWETAHPPPQPVPQSAPQRTRHTISSTEFHSMGPAISMDGSPASTSFASYVQQEHWPMPIYTQSPQNTQRPDSMVSQQSMQSPQSPQSLHNAQPAHDPHNAQPPQPGNLPRITTLDSVDDEASMTGPTLVHYPTAPSQSSLAVQPLFNRRTSAHSDPQYSQSPSNLDPASYLASLYQNFGIDDRSHRRGSIQQNHERASSRTSVASRTTVASTETLPQYRPQQRKDSSSSSVLNIASSTIQGGNSSNQGRPCKANGYHGFCKGAWSVQEGFSAGFDLNRRPYPGSLYNMQEFYKCKHCKFEGLVFNANTKARHFDTKTYTANCGVEYKWIFLAKCHVAMKLEKQKDKTKGAGSQYRCPVCYLEGSRSEVFGDAETLMNHMIGTHKGMSVEHQQRTKAILGRRPNKNEEYDIVIP